MPPQPARAIGNPAFVGVLMFLLGIVGTFAVVGVRTDGRLVLIEYRLGNLESQIARVGSFQSYGAQPSKP